ncbi:MAG: hypothetical protein ACYC6C_07725 [Coriobacteriia bacterium]
MSDSTVTDDGHGDVTVGGVRQGGLSTEMADIAGPSDEVPAV